MTKEFIIFAASISSSSTTWVIYRLQNDDLNKFLASGLPDLPEEHFVATSAFANTGTLVDIAKKIAITIRRQEMRSRFNVSHLAVSSFGPFMPLKTDLADIASFGRMSPRQEALDDANQNLVQLLKTKTGLTPFLITDANAVALGELVIRAQRRQEPENRPYPFTNIEEDALAAAYRNAVIVALIFGKGVGGGITIGGQVMQHNYHPEMGHLPVQPMPGEERPCRCRFHKDCVTGYAELGSFEYDSGGIISPKSLEIFAYYAAQLCAAATYMLGPDAIVLAGSTIYRHSHAVPLIRAQLKDIFAKREKKRDVSVIEQEKPDLLDRFISTADQGSYLAGTLMYGVLRAREGRLAELSPRLRK